MGDVTDMILEGILCDGCGVYLGDGGGFPQNCGCNQPARSRQNRKKKRWGKSQTTTSNNSNPGAGQSVQPAQERKQP